MPSYVILEKCDGCKGQDKTACQHICPNDLMVLNADTMKAYNRDPAMCWECYNCVKICPQQAMAVRGYADFIPMGGSVTPLRGTEDIMWTVKFRNQSLKRFRFATRTTPEGSAVPDGGFKTAPAAEDLKSPLLATEPESLGVPGLPTLKGEVK
ncbi:MAG: adenylyl-sulfate reductase subunit beta [Chloroflexota bacterium]